MFSLADIAPDIAARMAASQAEQEAHQAECDADPCERCGRFTKPPPSVRVDAWSDLAYRSIPEAYDGATMQAPWLVALVGYPAHARAKISLLAKRVVFVGLPAMGKTSLAVAMFRARLEAERPTPAGSLRRCGSRYMSALALAKARSIHPLGAGEAPLVAEALACPLLLVDELGGEDPSLRSAVAEVIYERHAASLPTWVTTGAEPAAIAQRYGGGIARRVFEGATVFRLGAKT